MTPTEFSAPEGVEPMFMLVLLLSGMMLVGLFFMIHLLVTWNRFHRPLFPLSASILLNSTPAFALIWEPFADGMESSEFSLHLFEFSASIALFTFTTLLPFVLAAATFQMVRVSLHQPSEDPLMDMIEG